MNLFEAMNGKFDKLEENSKELGSEKRLGEIIQENFFNEDEGNKALNESLNEATDNYDWKQVVKEYCRKNGYELLFVNDDSFGYEDKDGNMIHKYVDELQAELESKDEPQLTSDDMNAGQWYESLKEDKSEKEYKGYKLKFYSSDENPRWHNVYQVTKPRPYDDQEYYWASSYDGESWKIVYKRKVIDEIDCTFEEIVDKLEEKNKDIKPRILNDSLKESTAENIKDGSIDYTGKPLSTFLQDVDHRSKVYMEYKDWPGSYGGASCMVHDIPWNFANCPIISVKVPEDNRFADFRIVVDASKAPRSINENLNMRKSNLAESKATGRYVGTLTLDYDSQDAMYADGEKLEKAGYTIDYYPGVYNSTIKIYIQNDNFLPLEDKIFAQLGLNENKN